MLFAEKTQRPTLSMHCEKVRMYYESLPFSQIVTLIMAVLMTVFMWPVADHFMLLGWFGIMILSVLWRIQVWYNYRRSDPLADAGKWRNQARLGSFIAGISWGMGVLFLMPHESNNYQAIMLVFVMGMAAGSAVTQASILSAAATYILTLIGITIIKLIMIGNVGAYALVTQLSLYSLFIISASKKLHTHLNELIRARQEARHNAHHDSLTDLPNRRLIADQLERDFSRARRHGHYGALLFIDLDNFKQINDQWGHHIGDAALKAFSNRVLYCIREEDMGARLGGDEFLILMPEIADDLKATQDHAMRIAESLRQRCIQDLEIDGHKISLTASIGVTCFPVETQKIADDVLVEADHAMYDAKFAGKNEIRLFKK